MNNWIDYTINPITGFKKCAHELQNWDTVKRRDREYAYARKYLKYINEDRTKRGELPL